VRNQTPQRKKSSWLKINKWQLVAYDSLIFICVAFMLLVLYSGDYPLTWPVRIFHTALAFICIFGVRLLGGVYRQIWRYGGIQTYIRLLLTDAFAFVMFCGLGRLVPKVWQIVFMRALSISALNLLGALSIRMVYRYIYKCGNNESLLGRVMLRVLKLFSGYDVTRSNDVSRIKVAIVGAGRVGVSLAEELMNNPAGMYIPRCFIDTNPEKIGRSIHDIQVLADDENIFTRLLSL